MPAAADLDRLVPPEAVGHILDADSSQHEAIEAVKAGAHLVMDGPPGTGKSQTIANIIAEALAAGRTVLFVSEKTAALDVVKRRLDRCGLGDFCLELHSHTASKKQVVGELGRCLELPPTRTPEVAKARRQITADRQKLNEFVDELHAVRPPFGWSAFRVHGELAQLDRGGARSRIAIKDPFEKDAAYVRQGAEILAGLADCATVITEPGGHPWCGCKLTTFTHSARDDAEYQVGRLSDVIPPAVKAGGGACRARVSRRAVHGAGVAGGGGRCPARSGRAALHLRLVRRRPQAACGRARRARPSIARRPRPGAKAARIRSGGRAEDR